MSSRAIKFIPCLTAHIDFIIHTHFKIDYMDVISLLDMLIAFRFGSSLFKGNINTFQYNFLAYMISWTFVVDMENVRANCFSGR